MINNNKGRLEVICSKDSPKLVRKTDSIYPSVIGIPKFLTNPISNGESNKNKKAKPK